jgi:hypothetical protein
MLRRWRNYLAKEEALLSLAAFFAFIQWLDYCYGKTIVSANSIVME